MSDDDFGTINVQRGERAREIEVLRQHYRQHREALARMTMDAPTEHLATEYQRLINEIDHALGKLNELEGGSAAVPPVAAPPVTPIAQPVERLQRRTAELPMSAGEPRSRLPLILGATVIVLALIAGLMWWRNSKSGGEEGAIIAETGTTAVVSTAPDTAVEDTPAPIPADGALTATPPAHDYGVIRKGTRAVRQFEITNNSDEPLSVAVARSTCRCLYYDHAPVIPPRAKETLTVTIDGAKAKSGALSESLKIAKKTDPAVTASVEVQAVIQ